MELKLTISDELYRSIQRAAQQAGISFNDAVIAAIEREYPEGSTTASGPSQIIDEATERRAFLEQLQDDLDHVQIEGERLRDDERTRRREQLLKQPPVNPTVSSAIIEDRAAHVSSS